MNSAEHTESNDDDHEATSKHSLNFSFESLSQGFAHSVGGDPTLKAILDEYIPESKEIDIEELKKSKHFIIKKYPDALFFGEFQKSHTSKNLRCGKGIMKYDNGRLFEGEWENDQRHGRGYERYPNGNIYQGEFQYGKAHGKGRYQWKNTNEVYDGEWSKGLRHGYGVWKRQNPKDPLSKHFDSYVGEWRNGKAEGFGVHTWANGDRYEGEWKSCMKHGKGTDLFGNGDKYSGMYKNGKPEGPGIYTWANGNYYEGEFKNGLKEGKGKWKKFIQDLGVMRGINQSQNSQENEENKRVLFAMYEGDYKKDKKHGSGTFIWASGNTYTGNYKDDEREGHGEMRWTDGSVYIGEWVRGIQHGYGKIIYPDGTIKEGYFENNIYIGPLPRGEYIKQLQQQIKQIPPKQPKPPKPKALTEEEERQVNMIFSPNSLAKGGLKSLDKSKPMMSLTNYNKSIYNQSVSPTANRRVHSLNKYSIHQIDEENSQLLSSLGVNQNSIIKPQNSSRQLTTHQISHRTPAQKIRNNHKNVASSIQSEHLNRDHFNEFLKQTKNKTSFVENNSISNKTLTVTTQGKSLFKGNGLHQGSLSMNNQQYLMGTTPLSNRKQKLIKQVNEDEQSTQSHQSFSDNQLNSRKQTYEIKNQAFPQKLKQTQSQQNFQTTNNPNTGYIQQLNTGNNTGSFLSNQGSQKTLTTQQSLHTIKASVPNLSSHFNSNHRTRDNLSRQSFTTQNYKTQQNDKQLQRVDSSTRQNQKQVINTNGQQYTMQRRNSQQRKNANII